MLIVDILQKYRCYDLQNYLSLDFQVNKSRSFINMLNKSASSCPRIEPYKRILKLLLAVSTLSSSNLQIGIFETSVNIYQGRCIQLTNN